MVRPVGHAIPLEVVGTMIEMADVAWNALEHRRDRKIAAEEAVEGDHLRSENLRLRNLLTENLDLLKALSKSPKISDDCPPELYKRLVDAVDTPNFLNKMESLHQESTISPNGCFPLNKTPEFGSDPSDVDIMVNVDHEEPSWWVWVSQDMDPDSLEEVSGIDNDNYVVINEEKVVDGIADFIARCILDNPKSKVLTPEDLQRAVTRILVDIKDKSTMRKVWEVGKVIYTFSTWGIALAGIYRHRAILKFAAKGVHTSTKLIMKAL